MLMRIFLVVALAAVCAGAVLAETPVNALEGDWLLSRKEWLYHFSLDGRDKGRLIITDKRNDYTREYTFRVVRKDPEKNFLWITPEKKLDEKPYLLQWEAFKQRDRWHNVLLFHPNQIGSTYLAKKN